MALLYRALNEIRNELENKISPVAEVKLMEMLTEKYRISEKRIKDYLLIFKCIEYEKELSSKENLNSRTWTISEKFMVYEYVRDLQGVHSMKQCLEEVSNLIGRTFNATQFVFYEFLKDEDIVKDILTHMEKLRLKLERDFPVVENNVLPPQSIEVDLVNCVQQLARNYQKINNKDFEYLLITLSNISTELANKDENVEKVQELQKQLNEKDMQVKQLQGKLNITLKEYEKLRNAISRYNSMNEFEKLSNLKDYNNELVNMVSDFSQSSA